MPPKQTKAKYFQKQEDDDECGGTPPTPIALEIKEKDTGLPAKKPRKPRTTMVETGITLPADSVTISKTEAKRLRREEKGPYIMSDKQKANVERLKILTQERKAKRDADTEENKQKLADQLASKKREEDLILAKTNRVKVNVRAPKPKKVKQVVAPEPVTETEQEEESESDTEYVEPVKRQRKPSAPKKRKAPVVESESENTDALVDRVRSIKNTITQAQHSSILSKFF